MSIWSFFFLSKIYLYGRGHLQFDFFLNFLLGVYAFLPWILPKVTGLRLPNEKPLRTLHSGVGVVLGALVLWHDTYFPPLRTLGKFLSDPVSRPSNDYLFEFVLEYWSTIEVSVVILIFLFCFFLGKKRINIVPWVACLVFFPPLHGFVTGASGVRDFQKALLTPQLGQGKPRLLSSPVNKSKPFDIVILQVCSMAWDDLKAAGVDQDPFLRSFDALFTRFNTATSYSTPAALRLLRSNCGQVSHLDLYQSAPNDCYLTENLKRIGYSTGTVFNHQGKLSLKMASDISNFSKADPPMEFSGLIPEIVNYDKAPVFNNYEVLNAWWDARLKSQSPRAAVYFNTVSLHGGNHFVGDRRAWWNRNRVDAYREVVKKTFEEFERFFDVIRESKRDVLVIMVPEHGAALIGTSIQGPDLRDIPLPKITTVPLGVRLIGDGWGQRKPFRVDRLVSYQVIPEILNQIIDNRNSNTDRQALGPSDFERGVELSYFAENENAATSIHEGGLYYQGRDRVWKSLSSEYIPEEFRNQVKK